MDDYSELKKLLDACRAENCDGPREFQKACEALFDVCSIETIAGLIAENERLERLAESRLLNWEAEGRALLEACSDRNQLKAENEALRKQIPSTKIVWCACGDGHAANSYGAGFMDANSGVCANCDAANGIYCESGDLSTKEHGESADLSTKGPDGLADLHKDAERYRWLRSQHWNESDMAVACHPKKSVKLGFDCPSGERLDHAIDAAMCKGVSNG